MALRAEKARLLGFESFAAYRLDDAMAKTPQAVAALLQSVWAPARALQSWVLPEFSLRLQIIEQQLTGN